MRRFENCFCLQHLLREPGNVFYSPTKTTVFSDPYTCAHACIFALGYPPCFSPSLIFFVFTLHRRKSEEYILYLAACLLRADFFRANRRVGKRKREKNARVRAHRCVHALCVHAIRDSQAYCETSRLVRRSRPRMHRVHASERACAVRKITGNESS